MMEKNVPFWRTILHNSKDIHEIQQILIQCPLIRDWQLHDIPSQVMLRRNKNVMLQITFLMRYT